MDGDGAAAAEGNTGEGSGSQITNSIPSDWTENETFKGFFGEDGSFDFEKFSEDYNSKAEAAAKLEESNQNQPVVPEKPEDYTFDFGDDYPLDEADATAQRELAKELGLTQEQYEGIVKHDIGRAARAIEEVEQGAKEAKEQLVKEWGGNVAFEKNLKSAAQAAVTFFGKEFADRIDLGNDPQLIKGLYLISQKLSEDTLKQGAGAGAGPAVGDDGEPRLIYNSMAGK